MVDQMPARELAERVAWRISIQQSLRGQTDDQEFLRYAHVAEVPLPVLVLASNFHNLYTGET